MTDTPRGSAACPKCGGDDPACVRCQRRAKTERLRRRGSAPSSSAATIEEFSAYDLRLRSIDREPGEPINLCTECSEIRVAHWSVWLHTPEWGPGNAGATRVLCTDHAMQLVGKEARRAKA